MGKRIRISNETLNCYGTWVRTDGVDLSQYERNPVLLWMHERGCVIGMVKDIRRENGEITGEPWFDDVREESRMAQRAISTSPALFQHLPPRSRNDAGS